MAHILLVDDQAVNRQYLAQLLGYYGHTTCEAADGIEALAAVRRQRPQLVITDILMPTMDGYELVRRLRAIEATATLPVIFYSAAYLAREAQALALACGVNVVMAKPSEPEAVVEAVGRALGESTTPAAAAPPAASRDGLEALADGLTRRVHELGAANARLARLLEFHQQIDSDGDTDARPLLDRFGAAVRRLVGCAYTLTWLLDETGALSAWAVSGADETTLSAVGSPGSVPAGLVPVMDGGSAVRIGQGRVAEGLLGDAHHALAPATLLAVPLSTAAGRRGLLCAVNKIGMGEFTDEDERAAVVLAGRFAAAHESHELHRAARSQLAVLEAEIVERRRAEDRLTATTAELRRLMAEIHTVRERERTHIARELHDRLGQSLTALKFDVARALKPGADQDGIAARRADLLAAVDGTIELVRDIATDLRPDMLDRLGLVPTIEWHVGEFQRRSGCRCDLSVRCSEEPTNGEVRTAVFRILQEALTNVARHAGATTVAVDLRCDDERLELTVTDDGGGLPADRRTATSLGLIGMRERAFLVGGTFDLHPARPHGVTLSVQIPTRGEPLPAWDAR